MNRTRPPGLAEKERRVALWREGDGTTHEV
jgi:hypothetical protein